MNYGDLKQRVADRLTRADLLTPLPPSPFAVIPDFVQDRIGYYQKSLFAPSEVLDDSITCVPHQNTYSLPRGQQAIFRVYVLLESVWLPVRRTDWFSDILDADVIEPPFVSLPYVFSILGQSIRIYPTPDQAYPLRLLGNGSPPAPVTDDEVNFWTDEMGAATLIIEAACAEISSLKLGDDVRAQRHMAAVRREELSLQEYTYRIKGPQTVRPWL